MEVEERIFDDDEKQRAWLEGCRREEVMGRSVGRFLTRVRTSNLRWAQIMSWRVVTHVLS